ncbi:MAG: hypothetical protein M3Q49_15595, partial [Actinomycetota bacterium]|nr:hypothetical protein [Actinomycetota bacterium]
MRRIASHVLLSLVFVALTGCASPYAIKAPESRGTAIAEDKPVALVEETAAERPETTAEVEEASQKAPVENVYDGAMSTEVREDLRGIPERVYVPNVIDGTVSVIDPKTFEIVDSYAVGELPYHVTPSWDMTELYVNNEASGTFTVIDPKTGRPKETVE